MEQSKLRRKASAWPKCALFLGVSSLLMAFFVPAAFAKRLIPVDSEPAAGSGLLVTVRDEFGPIDKAQVWIETAEGKLLAVGETSDSGRFVGEVPDSALTIGVSITAVASRHAAVSFLESSGHKVSLELPLILPDSYAVFSGRLTGFKDNDDESKATAGLVAKAFEITDLVQLDVSSFVSPLKDTIDVFGSRQIPSNLVLPDQTFPIYFIPIHVNKPMYRLPALTGTSARYFGVTGTLNVQEAVGIIRGGSAWDIVNLLEFSKVGITQPVTAPQRPAQAVSLDIVSDTEIRGSSRFTVGRNTTSGESRRLVVALWEPVAGAFVPTDLKQIQGNEVTLSTVTPNASVIDLLISAKGDHFRGSWVRGATTSIPDAGLTADVTIDRLDGTWLVHGGETAQLAIAHLEEHKTTSVGGSRYEDRWVLVGPRKGQLRLPAAAYKAMVTQLGTISHVSVDLLQMGHGSYPFIDGESSAAELSALEKVRKKVR